ncbi:unnamed protein product [Euphydryas editha]|uniref:HAUS augmin-like complex subunit 6 N-terminal domain-containing protein n=1 Tax=Euphydryas editha TaxID=104508 RepID=A0AAU9UGI6_EUPED|nr:unnamed protein product [Euphydryas editha]
MTTILMQRDLVVTLKKETNLNVGLLSKLHPMLSDLSSLILKDNALEKPTQNLFNNLSYYLVSIIDPQVHASLPWPLYDTKAERAYRNELSSFISNYSSKGLLTHVMSSYLVNPGCFKVTVLLFQLSQLAVNRVLVSKMVKENKKILYNTMTDKYKSQEKEGFVECIDKETEKMLSKFSNYLYKRKIMEEIAFLFRKKITEMERKLTAVNGQGYINNLVDNFIKNHASINDTLKKEILKIKNLNEQSRFFESWLSETDSNLNIIEDEWNTKVSPLLKKSKNILKNTEEIINRHTGQVERSSYMIEYDPKTDSIGTSELQDQVNSQQKYVLRNLETDGVQNFPNLIRAFVISICFILKNNEVGDEVYNFNKYLEGGKRNYGEIVGALKILIQRVLNAEAKIQSSPLRYNQTVSVKDYPEIPPIPDLSDLKTNRDQYQVFFDTFTPLNLYKHQFNLRRRTSGNFLKPQLKSLTAPFYQSTKDDFLKSLISCRISSYDNANTTQNIHNMSVISNIKVNETISECSAGFTKQQIIRLLSTKKSSSSKKFKYKQDRPNINIKKGGLFNESINSNEANNLFRSYSSPNLFENREKMSLNKIKGRKLSIMQEDSPPQLDVSGIACLDSDSNYNTPHALGNAESSRQINSSGFPIIKVTKEAENRINNVLNEFKVDLSNDLEMDSTVSPILEVTRKSLEQEIQSSKTETPKTNTSLIKKSSSLEKIINRFKKVRANVTSQKKIDLSDINTIVEEKENINFDVYTANRVLLPDLLSPSCSTLSSRSNNVDYLDQICNKMDEVAHRKPRESLGTALGVDQTFLDQFELID